MMRHLSIRARLYVAGCYILGGLGLCWLIFGQSQPVAKPGDWLLGSGLMIVAAVSQVFVVARASTTGERSDHLTLAPVFAATLLLPGPILALLLIVTFLPEWYFHRRPWFGQLFNMSQMLIAAALTRSAFFYLTGSDRLIDEVLLSLKAAEVLLLIPIFQLTQALILGWVLQLTRGQSFRANELFTVDNLLLESGLTCLGLGFAIAWLIDPIYSLLTAPPLVLIFQAIHVPNLKEEAATDPKTGLANMRHFNEVMKRDLERACRNGHPLSLLICDLDYLRNINNTYGHQAGDVVLLGIADILRRHIRSSDVAARFGGEEFVVLLADTSTDGAQTVAERIRSDLEHVRFEVPSASEPISATVSIGVASYPHDGRTAEQLLRAADLAVYQAKRDGRNRVVIAGHESQALAGAWACEYLVSAEAVSTAQADESPRPFWGFIEHVTRAAHPPSAHPASSVSGARPEAAIEPRQPWQLWHAEYRRLLLHYVVLITLILVIALSYEVFGALSILALIAPMELLRFAFKQYIDRTNAQMTEIQALNERLTSSYEATLHALSRALDARDEDTIEHSQRVKRYSELIAQRLQLTPQEIEDIGRGALLHDIGKIAVPDAILLKPGQLTPEEQALMRQHPEIGYRMIAHIPFLAHAAQVVLHHHEAYDGSGYPSGLSGANIPLGARIFAIADAFDALTTDRPYRKALSLEAACAEIKRCRGTQFDPSIVDLFLATPTAELKAARGQEDRSPPSRALGTPTSRSLALAAKN